MSCYSTMSSLKLHNSVRCNQYACHHCKTSKSSCNHIRHDIAVIVFASPNKSTITTHYSCNRVVNQSVKILYTGFFKFFLIFVFKYFVKNIFKSVVINFAYSIFGRKPNILICLQSVIKTRFCKADN